MVLPLCSIIEKFRGDWAIPRMLTIDGSLTRDDVEKIIEGARDGLELMAFESFVAPRYAGMPFLYCFVSSDLCYCSVF